jgi:hypothetical protein
MIVDSIDHEKIYTSANHQKIFFTPKKYFSDEKKKKINLFWKLKNKKNGNY